LVFFGLEFRNGSCGPPLAQVKKAGMERNRKIGSNRIKTLDLGHEGIVVIQTTVILRRTYAQHDFKLRESPDTSVMVEGDLAIGS